MAVLVIVDKKGLGNLSKAINVALCGIIWSPVVSGKRKQEGFEGSGAHDFPERPNVVQRLHVCPQRPTIHNILNDDHQTLRFQAFCVSKIRPMCTLLSIIISYARNCSCAVNY